MKTNYYIYILECADNTLYTGYTNDLENRLKAHNEGKGAKYTKSRLPVKLVYSETFDDNKEAMSREWFIKHRLTREEKLELIKKGKPS
ncbi:MAG: GIY-YIG nuclease family protein [Lachnospiraceae bacterium]|nr:GIY-YIG nuclease family protein [Lachnospiraceae bacterium]